MTEYYVRTDGSDSNDGLTNSSGGAWLTVQKAADTVTGAGDNVNIQAGTYSEDVSRNTVGDGTEGNPISFIGNSATVSSFEIRGDDHIKLQSINFNSTSNTLTGQVHLHTAHRAIIQDCSFVNARVASIAGRGVDGSRSNTCEILNNTFDKCQRCIVCYGDAGGGGFTNSIGKSGWYIFGNKSTELTWHDDSGINDIDFIRLLSGDFHTIKSNWCTGNTLESVYNQYYGTHTGGSSSTVMTDSTITIGGSPGIAYVGNTIKNLTTSATGTVTSTTATTITCSGELSGGGRDNLWANGDEWTMSATPHVDAVQTFNSGNEGHPVSDILIEDNIFETVNTGIQFSNAGDALNSDWVVRRNVIANGLEIKFLGLTNGGSPFNCTDMDLGTNVFEHNTSYTMGQSAVWLDSVLDTHRNNVYQDVGSQSYTFTGTTTVTDNDYNQTNPNASPDAGANDLTGAVTFEDDTDVIGPDDLIFTADDGLRLASGSVGLGGASDGTDVGAYQQTIRYRARQL